MRKTNSNLLAAMHNSAWLVAVPATRMLVGFSIGVLVMRHLGPSAFGRLSGALATLALVAPLADLGLTTFLRTELLARRDQAEKLLSTIFLLRLGAAFVSTIVAFTMALVNEPESLPLVLAACLILFTPVFLTPEQWFSNQLNSRVPAIAQIGAIVVAAVLRLVLVTVNAPLVAFAACSSVEAVVAGIALFAMLRGEIRVPWLTFDRSLVKPAFVASLPLLFTVLALAWQTRLDQLLLLRFAGHGELGLYAAAVRFSELAPIAISSVSLSLFPRFNARHREDPKNPAPYLQEMLDLLVTLALLWAIFCTTTARFWLPRVLGPAYAGAAPLLAIHAWTSVFHAMGFARSTLWTLERRNHFTLMATLIGCAATTALNFVFIPKYGAIACAWLALLGTIITNFLTSVIAPGGGLILRAQIAALAGLRGVWRRRRDFTAAEQPSPPA